MANVRPQGGAAKGQGVVAPSAAEILNLAVGSQFGPRISSGISKIISPGFKGLPVSAGAGEFDDIIPLTKLVNSKDTMSYYDNDQSGYDYANLAQNYNMDGAQDGEDETPAPISVVPTSTTNPERPRTVAAGYDSTEGKITVVFRDGTYYNYYQVTPVEWQGFKARVSKGRYILSYLDSKPRGPADVGSISAEARRAFYKISRAAQLHYGGRPDKVGKKTPKPKKP
jgi:hypothetical protein